MTQHALERSVARATGEDMSMIRRLGFILVRTPDPRRRQRNHRDSNDHAPDIKPTAEVTTTRSA